MNAARTAAPRTVLIGANGQLGSDIVRAGPSEQLTTLTHADVEVADRARLFEVLATLRPDLVINTAAFRNVDRYESEPDRAFVGRNPIERALGQVLRRMLPRTYHVVARKPG